jgi:type IV secretion system protein TrbI
MGGWPSDYPRFSLRGPVLPYEAKAGTTLPAVMLSAVNSDLPGQVLGPVQERLGLGH